MRIFLVIGGIGAGGGGFLVTFRGGRAAPLEVSGPTNGARLADVLASLRRLREATGEALLGGRLRIRGAAPRAASATSAEPLSLNVLATSARLRSSEEINTVPTSYGAQRPTWTGASSADPTVSGIYDGAQGDTTLTFRALLGGIVGLTTVRLEVRDAANALVGTLQYGFGYGGTALALPNGLAVALSSGSVIGGNTFTVDVSASNGSAPRIDRPFNGTFDDAPNFEPGVAVGAGSFTINGATIAVAANDSIATVLGKINASAAGVLAVYDAAQERVVLTSTATGSAAGIALGSDGSGFLAALKLAGATLEPGLDDERRLAIAAVPALAGIASGTFLVNGTTFAIDRQVDSLLDVLERIGAAGIGAQASFDAVSGRAQVRGSGGGNLTLDDGSSGLFTALGIESGTFVARKGTREASFADTDDLRGALAEVARAIAALHDGAAGGFAGGAISAMRAQVAAAVEEALAGREREARAVGIQRSADPVAGPLDVDPLRLARAARRRPQELALILLGDERVGGSPGLLEALNEAARSGLATLGRISGDDRGARIDTFA